MRKLIRGPNTIRKKWGMYLTKSVIPLAMVHDPSLLAMALHSIESYTTISNVHSPTSQCSARGQRPTSRASSRWVAASSTTKSFAFDECTSLSNALRVQPPCLRKLVEWSANYQRCWSSGRYQSVWSHNVSNDSLFLAQIPVGRGFGRDVWRMRENGSEVDVVCIEKDPSNEDGKGKPPLSWTVDITSSLLCRKGRTHEFRFYIRSFGPNAFGMTVQIYRTARRTSLVSMVFIAGSQSQSILAITKTARTTRTSLISQDWHTK